MLADVARRAATPEDAADVLAETYLVAWRRIADLPEEPDTRPWLFGVAHRPLANQRRSDRRRGALTESLIQQAAATVAAHRRPPDESLQARRLTHALGGLSESDREIPLLAGGEGLSPAEIATVLECSAATARVRLHRARRRLRERLDSAELDAETLRSSSPWISTPHRAGPGLRRERVAVRHRRVPRRRPMHARQTPDAHSGRDLATAGGYTVTWSVETPETNQEDGWSSRFRASSAMPEGAVVSGWQINDHSVVTVRPDDDWPAMIDESDEAYVAHPQEGC